MKRNINTSTLTKSYIESKISQVDIMAKYLNIPKDVILDCIDTNKLIPSVFRDDGKKPSMGFTINKQGKLKVRDFGGFGFFEDVYGTVAYVLSHMYNRKIESNNKQDFYFILQHIARTFGDHINNIDSSDIEDFDIATALNKVKHTKPIIEIVPRSWNKQDKEIWSMWGVSLSYLNTNFVVPVDQYYINRGIDTAPKYRHKTSDPCYAYMLGQNRNGIHYIKLYFPLRKREREQKFVTNAAVIEGLLNLELDNYDYIIITKSSKDRLSIGNHLSNHLLYGESGNKLNIGVVNVPSESYKLKLKEYEYLKSKLKDDGMMFTLFDFDETGRACAKYAQEEYNIPYMFITRGEFGLPNYKAKDFAELCEIYNTKQINQFINETYTYVKLRYKELSISY